ncbi:MAG: site-2 protease family protein [Pyrinomonadaceae bacterium]|nr:site-2 protease family protein [Pyrinomonadaceae bacterium]
MQDIDSLTRQFFDRRTAMRPTWRTWLRHAALFLFAFCTITVAGSLQPFGPLEIFPGVDPQTTTEIVDFLANFPSHYLTLIIASIISMFSDPAVLQYGLTFSISLLFILTAHEFGHYIACRLYGVDATLPFFIPLPPLLGPAGTLGAFIKIVSPMPSRRATFDIGVAGPIAGFIALIPIAVLGLLTAKPAAHSPDSIQAGLHFSEPLFTRILGYFLGIDPTFTAFNAFSAAAWLGLLITSLNLIPSGQLDGGHAVYSVFGEKIHFWTGRIAFIVMIVLSILGMYFYSSPSGLLFAVLLFVMMRVRHPEPLDNTPLDRKRLVIAFLTLVIFALSFVPFPVQVL